MADLPAPASGHPPGPGWAVRLARSPRFHRIAARVPGLRRIAAAEGAALFDLMQGFVRSQVLTALVELRVLHRLADGPRGAADLAPALGLSVDRTAILLRAGAGLGLLRARRGGRFALSRRGAAFLAVPGLEAMVRHHAVLYGDLADPVALLRGDGDPALARFWPYVFGAGAADDPGQAAEYSRLMTDTMGLVAEDTLRLVPLRGVDHLMDVGGGGGAFLAAAGDRHPDMALTLFDLPTVVPSARARLARFGGRARIVPGSFRDDPLPVGADAISLVRVLYDHAGATVAALLRAVHDALPPGGKLIVAEPMSGGARPDPATDVYFALYTLAMETGRTRSSAEVAGLAAAAGFDRVRVRPGDRPYVTSAVTARRPATGGTAHPAAG